MAKGCKNLHFLFHCNQKVVAGKGFLSISPIFSELARSFWGHRMSEVAGLDSNVLSIDVGQQLILRPGLCEFLRKDWHLGFSGRGIGGFSTQIRSGIPASEGRGRDLVFHIEWASGFVR